MDRVEKAGDKLIKAYEEKMKYPLLQEIFLIVLGQ